MALDISDPSDRADRNELDGVAKIGPTIQIGVGEVGELAAACAASASIPKEQPAYALPYLNSSKLSRAAFLLITAVIGPPWYCRLLDGGISFFDINPCLTLYFITRSRARYW